MKGNHRILFVLLFMLMPLIPVLAASPGDIVINEIAWMGTDHSSSDEWVELYNTTDQAIDLTGWTMEDDGGTIDMSFSGVTIPSRGFILIENSEDTVSDIPGDVVDSSIGLSNDGENLILKDNLGNTIDTVNCSGAWYAGSSSPNYTMERKNPMVTGTLSTNWANNDGTTINGLDADSNTINGTPKAANSVAEGGTAVYVLIDVNLDKMEVSGGTPNASNIEVKLVDENYLIDKTEDLNITLTQTGPGGTFTANPVNCLSGYGTSIIQSGSSSGTITVSATLPSGYTAVISDDIYVSLIDSSGPIAKSSNPSQYIQKNLVNFVTMEITVDEQGGMVEANPINLNYRIMDPDDNQKGSGFTSIYYDSGAEGGGDTEPVYGSSLIYKGEGIDFTNGGSIPIDAGDFIWIWLTGTDYKGQGFVSIDNSSTDPLAKIEVIETKLVITEVNFEGDAGGIDGDWVEIYCVDDGNGGNGTSLNGYYIDDLDSIGENTTNSNYVDLTDMNSNADKIIGNVTIKTGEYILLQYDSYNSDQTSASNKLIKLYTSDSGLTGSDEQVAIISPEGKVLDVVAWADYSGSLSDSDLNDDYISLTGQWNLSYGSPGSADEEDCVSSDFSSGTIVRDSENTDTNDKSDWFHTEYATPGGPHPPDSLPSGTVLVINEVMFSPGIDKSDWIELYCKDDGNNGNGVNIGGCYFQTDSIIKTIKDRTRIKTGEYLVLFEGRSSLDEHYAGPDGVISVYDPDLSVSGTDEGVILKDFSGTIEDVVIYAQKDTSSYLLPVDSNGDLLPGATAIPNTILDTIEAGELIDVSYIEYNDNLEILDVIDTDKGISHWVGYNAKFFPNLAKYPDWPGGTESPNYDYVYDWVYTIYGAVDSGPVKDGYSITRDDKATDTNTAADWSISETPTIGRPSDEEQNPPITISDIQIEPNPFVNDGSDPARVYTNIKFNLNTQAIITIRIYDIQGRIVRTLINNKDTAMGEFDIKWFGNDNKNRPAPIGVYILYIEAINDVSTAVKKKTVVVGKKL